MRAEILFRYFASLATLKGVGARTVQRLNKLCGERVVDLLFHLPRDIVDRRLKKIGVDLITPGEIITTIVYVESYTPPFQKGRPWRVHCLANDRELELVFFRGADQNYISRLLPVESERVVSGRLEQRGQKYQIAHPDFVLDPNNTLDMPAFEPVYPLSQGLTSRYLNKFIQQSLHSVATLPEWHDQSLLTREKWLSFNQSLEAMHRPQSPNDIAILSPARRRLAYDELLASQFALALVRQNRNRKAGRSIQWSDGLTNALRSQLDFKLTQSQEQAIKEVCEDMTSGGRMLRLLQGDVGSGKTMVAIFAMLMVAEANSQSAILAPTEILAQQHYATLQKLLTPLGIEVVLITGRHKGRIRKELVERLSSSQAKIAIGTHALLQDDIVFHDLALIVIDEQHRFGVFQRLAMATKGQTPDMLVMTATPIPRTLMLAGYGDMEQSRLLEKPQGRKPIKTIALPQDRMSEVFDGIARQIKQAARVYWICPLVEETETLDLTAAEDRHQMLSDYFGADHVGLMHGRMKPAEKDKAMEAFKEGQTKLLVATTVIEVGVDVPEATIMIIEHAERFGLAQLHQLRGRVGRNDIEGFCVLIYGSKLSEVSRKRLSVMRETNDGFVIAEQDLKLRGGGEFLGTKQSGMPSFKLADLSFHMDLLEIARDDAKLLLHKDPNLTSPRGMAVRNLLYLFEQDEMIRTISSG